MCAKVHFHPDHVAHISTCAYKHGYMKMCTRVACSFTPLVVHQDTWAVTGGGCTTHGAATLSAPLKLADLLICIGKHAAANFKVLLPVRPDWGMGLC